MNLSAKVYARLIPEGIITEAQWVAWNGRNEVSGIVRLNAPLPESFLPFEQVDQNKLLEWVKGKIDVSEIEKQLNY